MFVRQIEYDTCVDRFLRVHVKRRILHRGAGRLDHDLQQLAIITGNAQQLEINTPRSSDLEPRSKRLTICTTVQVSLDATPL